MQWHCWLGDRKGIWPVKNHASAIPKGSSLKTYQESGQTWSNRWKKRVQLNKSQKQYITYYNDCKRNVINHEMCQWFAQGFCLATVAAWSQAYPLIAYTCATVRHTCTLTAFWLQLITITLQCIQNKACISVVLTSMDNQLQAGKQNPGTI